jgi:hypothetical protein
MTNIDQAIELISKETKWLYKITERDNYLYSTNKDAWTKCLTLWGDLQEVKAQLQTLNNRELQIISQIDIEKGVK